MPCHLERKNHRHINQRLQFFRSAAEGVILRHYGLNSDGATIYADLEAALFPDKVEEKIEAEKAAIEEEKAANGLLEVAKRFTAMKKESTRLTYERTVKHLEAFISKGQTNVLDEVNKSWLTAFDNYLAESNPSPNARALHFRNLRAIFNYALDEVLTANYPFRRFKIKTVENPGSDDPWGQVDLTPEAKIGLTPLPKIKMTPVDIAPAGDFICIFGFRFGRRGIKPKKHEYKVKKHSPVSRIGDGDKKHITVR